MKDRKLIWLSIPFYKKFCDYFLEEWSKYFKDKSLVLNDVHIKARTNNSLENFKRTIKYSYNKKNNMKLI